MRRRLLLAAVAGTALVMLVDLSGRVDLGPVRASAATALGPLEWLVGPAVDEGGAAELSAAVRTQLGDRGDDARLDALLAAPGLAGTPVVLARVVAVGRSGPAGPERVTIDAGSRDGVEVDRTVVAAEGLVGRVVSVAPWTSDVLLLGSRDLAVGVRVGADGVLGEVTGSAAAGAPALRPGTLSVALVERGVMAPGDDVVTLGSIDGRPYVPGVRVGTVRHVDPGVGRLAPTGTVRPAVDPTSLDVVAVVVAPRRTTPRPVVTPTSSGTPTGSG